MRLRMMFLQVLACCLSMIACHQSDSQRDYPAPPNTSYRLESLLLTTDDTSHSLRGAFVTPDFIKAVRAQPLLGRYFAAEEYQSKSQKVVVLSHRLWEQRFGSDPTQIGKNVVINERAYTIVGVMPKGFDIPEGADVWLAETASGG
jgi:hypothetical protein